MCYGGVTVVGSIPTVGSFFRIEYIRNTYIADCQLSIDASFVSVGCVTAELQSWVRSPQLALFFRIEYIRNTYIADCQLSIDASFVSVGCVTAELQSWVRSPQL